MLFRFSTDFRSPTFDSLDFEVNPQFRKVATVHSFFVDEFEIRKDSIIRRGEPCGRFATDIDQGLVDTYEINLRHVLNNVFGDLTQTDCQAVPNPCCDPNELQEKKSIISFECLYTIKVATSESAVAIPTGRETGSNNKTIRNF